MSVRELAGWLLSCHGHKLSTGYRFEGSGDEKSFAWKLGFPGLSAVML
jgi:hypothetical protein